MFIGFPQVGPTGDFTRDALILAGDLQDFAQYGIRSFREPLEMSVRQVVIPSIRKNFAAEGRPAWRPLALATVVDRAKLQSLGKIKTGASGPILDRTGKLKKVATQLNIWSYTRESATITGIDSRVKYATYHQTGTRKMPARPFILLQDEDEERIEQIFYHWLDGRMRKVGRL